MSPTARVEGEEEEELISIAMTPEQVAIEQRRLASLTPEQRRKEEEEFEDCSNAFQAANINTGAPAEGAAADGATEENAEDEEMPGVAEDDPEL